MSAEMKPRVLIVYYTLTKQSGRVVDAITKAFQAQDCHVTEALIEFIDERWVQKLSQFPMRRPIAQIGSSLRRCATRPGRSAFLRKHNRAITTSS